jgi:SAM-dependent methyltransferase
VRWERRFQYASRAERAKFIAEVYGEFLAGDVLDVGCSGAALREAVTGRYVGIDIAGQPDLVVNLEKERIPLPDDSFDCVVCSDVLEHLDNLHQTFDELVRVSRRYVLISLPNCFNYENVFRIWTGRRLKFYGLPVRPDEDRHKWFFGHHEAEEFFRANATRLGLGIVGLDHLPLRYRGLKGGLLLALVRVLSVTPRRFAELGTLATWVVLEKKSRAAGTLNA